MEDAKEVKGVCQDKEHPCRAARGETSGEEGRKKRRTEGVVTEKRNGGANK